MSKSIVEFLANFNAKTSTGFKAATAKIASLKDDLAKIKQKGLDVPVTNKTKSGLNYVRDTIGKIGAAVGFFELGKSVIKLGTDMEQTRVAFGTLLGDVEKGNDVISKLQDFSKVTPFTPEQVTKAGKGLVAFGVDAEKLTPTLQKIGDIASGTGKDFNELSIIYGKAKVAGTLYAEDINQLVEAGIPIMGEFAKALGTTEGQVKKMASQGKLSFDMLDNAFTNLTTGSGRFTNLMEKQSKTIGGRWSTLVGIVTDLGVRIGESLNPVLGVTVDILTDTVKWLDENKQILEWVAVGVASLTTAWGLYNAIMAISTLKTKLFTQSQILLNTILNLNPIMLVVSALAALGVGLFLAYKKSETFRAVVDGLWSGIKQIGSNIWEMLKPLMILKDIFMNIIDLNLDGLLSNFQTIFTELGNMFSDFLNTRMKPFLDAWNHVKNGDFAKAAGSLAKGVFGITPVGMAAEAGSKLIDKVTENVGDAYQKGNLWSKIRSKMDGAESKSGSNVAGSETSTGAESKSGSTVAGSETSNVAGSESSNLDAQLKKNVDNRTSGIRSETKHISLQIETLGDFQGANLTSDNLPDFGDKMIEEFLRVANSINKM